jgi:hypothetical protein
MFVECHINNVVENKSEPGRVAPVFPGRHGPALMGKCDIVYLIGNSSETCVGQAIIFEPLSHSKIMLLTGEKIECRDYTP